MSARHQLSMACNLALVVHIVLPQQQPVPLYIYFDSANKLQKMPTHMCLNCVSKQITWYRCFKSMVFFITGSTMFGSFDLSVS